MTIDRSRIRYVLFIALISLVGVVMIGGNAFAAQGDTTRVSVNSTGGEGNLWSEQSVISDDGRFVAFISDATNLVAGDTNGFQDVFVHNRDTGETTRVSVDSAGTEASGGGSGTVAISGDGRYVVFVSFATNLVTDDTNASDDVFVHDLDTGETTRVSVDSNDTQATGHSSNPAISGDGRYVTFHSGVDNLVIGDTNNTHDVFVHDRNTGDTTRVSVDSAGIQANNFSSDSAISSDGRYVVFESWADNLAADDTNDHVDVFVHDRDTRDTTRVSIATEGTQATSDSDYPAISDDGRYVTFNSAADNLVTEDTNNTHDVFVHDRATLETTRVSVDTTGTEATGGLSGTAAISGDGRYVTFNSWADNLVTGDTNANSDVFVHDRTTAATTRVSVDSAGAQGNHGSHSPAITGDGRYVSFYSSASNLVTGDSNNTEDVFVHEQADPVAPTTTTTEPSTTTTTAEPPEVAPVDAFTDDDSSVFEDDINTIAAAGITMGCNPPLNDQFCPNDPLTRGQMGAFLNRAFDLAPSGVDWFTDDNTSVFETDLNATAAAGITRGCTPPLNDRYCPDDYLTRGQMAAFLTRAFDLAPSALDWFTDDNTSIFDADINATAAAGITRGCNPPVNDEYCADDHLTRGQMAALLNRAIAHNNDRSASG